MGEHSDWIVQYPDIGCGSGIVVPTNEGIYARVRRIDERNVLLLKSLGTAERFPFAGCGDEVNAYVRGCVFVMRSLLPDDGEGIEIDVYRVTLPVKKGLSSSAAICVLVVRAFNIMFSLGLSKMDEVDLAHRAEVSIGSLCGKLDQPCPVFGVPLHIVFRADAIELREIRVGGEFHIVVVDLNAAKDTMRILRDLNACFPFARTPAEENVHSYLGPINRALVQNALACLEAGDAPGLGECMNSSQACVDKYLAPVCPSELTSPLLHHLISFPPLQPLIYGAKGVGSLGDGSVQFLLKNSTYRDEFCSLITTHFPTYKCLSISLTPT